MSELIEWITKNPRNRRIGRIVGGLFIIMPFIFGKIGGFVHNWDAEYTILSMGWFVEVFQFFMALMLLFGVVVFATSFIKNN
jgi:hypothetical protein